jgi:hypothetical protein
MAAHQQTHELVTRSDPSRGVGITRSDIAVPAYRGKTNRTNGAEVEAYAGCICAYRATLARCTASAARSLDNSARSSIAWARRLAAARSTAASVRAAAPSKIWPAADGSARRSVVTSSVVKRPLTKPADFLSGIDRVLVGVESVLTTVQAFLLTMHDR